MLQKKFDTQSNRMMNEIFVSLNVSQRINKIIITIVFADCFTNSAICLDSQDGNSFARHGIV